VLTSTLDENGEEVIKPKHKPRIKQKHKKKKQEE
jgi:hypothetical protein